MGKRIPKEVAHLRGLETLLLDEEHIEYPEPEIVSQGTEAIMRFLCSECQIDYIAPSEYLPSISETNGKTNGVKEAVIDPYDQLVKGHLAAEEKKKEEKRQQAVELERQMVETQDREQELNRQNTKQKKKLLDNLAEEENKMEVEMIKFQKMRNEEVLNLCTKLEMALMHGMKVSTPSLGMAVIKNVKDLVSNNFGSTENGGVWRIMRTILNKHEYERYLMLANVTNDTGRGRAWLRSVLNEQSLERYLHMLLGDEIRLKEFYEEWAFMRDQERSSMLPSMAAGLCSIRFALKVDNSALNGNDESILSPTFAASLTGFLPSLKPQVHSNQNTSPTIAAEVTTDQVIDTSKVRTKKKKKIRAPAQIVSFDDDSTQHVEGFSVSESAPS